MYVTVDVQACSESQMKYRAYVDSNAATPAVGPISTSTFTSTSASNLRSAFCSDNDICNKNVKHYNETFRKTVNDNKKNKNDGRKFFINWLWYLSGEVCNVLKQIERGSARRSADMWRVGNVIANSVTSVRLSDNGAEQKEDRIKSLNEVERLECDVQTGASFFLCHYLETLSDRSSAYQSPVLDGRSDEVHMIEEEERTKRMGKECNEEEEKNQDELNLDTLKTRKEEPSEDFTSLLVWERMFFAVPSPIDYLQTTSSASNCLHQQASTKMQPPSINLGNKVNKECPTAVCNDTAEEKDVSSERGKRGEGGGLKEIRGVGTRDGDYRDVSNGTEVVPEKEKEAENEEEEEESCSNGVRRLRQDILALSTDPRLLKIRDFISQPALAALSTSSADSSTTSKLQSQGLSLRQNIPKNLKVTATVSMSWKRSKQQLDVQKEKMVDSRRDESRDKGRESTLQCCSDTEQIDSFTLQLQKGEKELLSLLIARILHGLSSKMLPAAAWKEQAGCWAQYRHYNFEFVFVTAMSILT